MFNQTFHNVNNVYNIGGDLVLNQDSTKDDLVKALKEALADIRQLPIDERDKQAAEAQLQAAVDESSQAKPAKSSVVDCLKKAESTLSTVSGATSKVLEIGKYIGQIAFWAASFFGS